jgi:hypothetical protein
MKNGNTSDILLTVTIECEMNKVDHEFNMTFRRFYTPSICDLMIVREIQ